MLDAHIFLKALATVLCVAAVTTVLFHRLRLPVVPAADVSATPCQLPALDARDNDKAKFGKYLIDSDPVSRGVRDDATGDSIFTTTDESAWQIGRNHYQSSENYRWQVNDARPAQAQYQGQRRNVFTIDGRVIDLATEAHIQSDATHFHVSFTKTLRQNGSVVREKTWTDSIPRHYQ